MAEPALPLSCANPQLGAVGYQKSCCKRAFWLFWPCRALLCFDKWHWNHLKQVPKRGKEDAPCRTPSPQDNDWETAHRLFSFLFTPHLFLSLPLLLWNSSLGKLPVPYVDVEPPPSTQQNWLGSEKQVLASCDF